METNLAPALEHIVGLLGALGLLALAIGVGDLIFNIAAWRFRNRAEHIALAAGLGLGTLSYLGFMLGMSELLSPGVVRIALLFCVITVIALQLQVRRKPPTKLDPIIPVSPAEILPTWIVGLLIAVGLFLLFTLVLSLTPVLDYDGLTYHVAAPKRWLEVGAMRFLPTHLQTEWPMGFEMLFMLLLPLTGSAGCKPLVFLTTLLVAATIYSLGERCANRKVGVVAAALFVWSAGMDKINTTSIEIALTYFVTLSALGLAGWRQAENDKERQRWLLLAAIFAGLANCTKLNGLLCTGILTLVVLILSGVLPGTSGQSVGVRTKHGMVFIGIALLCALPWYLRTWHDTGNPIYPFAYSLLGGRDWNSSAAHVLTLYFRYFNLPGPTPAIRQAFLIRQLLKVTALITVGVSLPSPSWIRLSLVTAGIFVFIQMLSSDQIRFLMPAAPFFVLAVGWWIVRLATRWNLAGWVVAISSAALYLPGAVSSAKSNFPVVLGLTSQPQFIQSYLSNYDACLWANRALPQDARVLIGPDTRAYYLKRDAYWSHAIVQREIPFDTYPEFITALQKLHIAYLIFDTPKGKGSTEDFEIRVGWRRDELERLKELAARSTPLWSGHGVTVYRLPFK